MRAYEPVATITAAPSSRLSPASVSDHHRPRSVESTPTEDHFDLALLEQTREPS